MIKMRHYSTIDSDGAAFFTRADNTIDVFPNVIKRDCPRHFVRSYIGVIFHELTHWWDWNVTCRKKNSAYLVLKDSKALEVRAHRVEDFILTLLFARESPYYNFLGSKK